MEIDDYPLRLPYELFYKCPRYDDLQELEEDARKVYGDERPLFCCDCEGPLFPRERDRHACRVFINGEKIRTPRQRRRLAKRINRALRRRKNQRNNENRVQLKKTIEFVALLEEAFAEEKMKNAETALQVQPGSE